MIKTTVNLFGLLVFSQMVSAQIVNTEGIVKQIDNLQRATEQVERVADGPVNEIPFSLSSLPAINEQVTKPLATLPKILTIGNDLVKPIIVEVEVEDGWRAVKNQWLVLADEQAKQSLINLGAVIESFESYSGLGLSLIRFSVPSALDSRQALGAHLSAQTMDSLDRNHIYQAQSQLQERLNNQTQYGSSNSGPWCQNSFKIGMIDSAIDQDHRVFSQANITAQSFLQDQLKSPTSHGTTVASILVGSAEGLIPLLPNAQLYSAAVFYRQSEYAQGATLSAMIEALNWLAEQNLAVINMSLAGPDNRILKRVIKAVSSEGVFIVAAAGNEGPAAPAVYPAGYEYVVAVSAFDSALQPYRWANQGDYIDFSALGVNVLSAQADQKLGKESGTSMAAPVVSAALACLLNGNEFDNKANKQQILDALSAKALDLGEPGKDTIFGNGAIVYRFKSAEAIP